MRFELSLTIENKDVSNILPLNYQYELSAFIYKTLALSDADYSEWLHNNGFTLDKKQFRLFTFSHLQIDKYKIQKDRLLIDCPVVKWKIAFLPEKTTEEFVNGVFKEQFFSIGDKHSKVYFRVTGIELLPEPDFLNFSEFHTLSPVCITRFIPHENRIVYENPESEYAKEALFLNLKNKFKAFYGIDFDGDDFFEFSTTGKTRSKLVTIKANTAEQTNIRGFDFGFKLKTDERLLKIMFHSGLGEKNAMGFGFVEKVKTK